MNNKVEEFFKENSFKMLKKRKDKSLDRYEYYKKQIFLFILSLINAIILSKYIT